MRISIFAAAAATTLVFSATAFAQADGPYVGAAVGGNFPLDMDLEDAGVTSDAEYDAGPMGALTLGYGLANGLRVEAELAHRENDIDSISGAANSTGEFTSTSAMANLLYDFWATERLSPYVGVGIGMAAVSADGLSPVGATSIDDNDRHPAFQGIAGLSYQVTESAQVFADYRFFHVEDAAFSTGTGSLVVTDYQTHSLMVGMRFFFGGPKAKPEREPAVAAAAPAPKPAAQPAPQPAPAPAAAPAPAQPEKRPELARSYQVFFAFDSTEISDAAAKVLQAAADSAGQLDLTRLNVTGHADRAGPDRYNVGLSQRRANAVANELVRLGVPRDEIVIMWKGESQPLIPTADGVSEPQNRRVEIVFE